MYWAFTFTAALLSRQCLGQSILSPCWNSKTCEKDLVCRSHFDEDKKVDMRCREKVKPGNKCFQSWQCTEGHICSPLKSRFGDMSICHIQSTLGQVCFNNWHCDTGLVCRAKEGKLVCQEKGDLGQICDLKDDCMKPYVCRKQYLTDVQSKCLNNGTLGQPCEYGQQCEPGLFCRESLTDDGSIKQCLKKSRKGEFCKYNSDCVKELHCRGDSKEPKRICEDRNSDIGDYCIHCHGSGADLWRRKWAGTMTTCQKYATRGEYCAEDWNCDGNLRCKIQPNGNGVCEYKKKKGDECYYNFECPPWLACRIPGPAKNEFERFCLDPLKAGSFCAKDADCETEVCIKQASEEGRICRDKLPLDSVCFDVSQCEGDLTCRRKWKTDKYKKCLAKLGSDAVCKYSTDCKENHSCNDGKCERTGVEYGKFCQDSWECKGSTICMNSKCMVCRQNWECPENHVCRAFKCMKQ